MAIVEYKSDNGYTGVLYGKSSMIIYAPDGSESIHTGNRAINSYEELVEVVDKRPQFMALLRSIDK